MTNKQPTTASAWPELPAATSAAASAGARSGVQGTFAVIGYIERRHGTEPGRKRAAFKRLLTSPTDSCRALSLSE